MHEHYQPERAADILYFADAVKKGGAATVRSAPGLTLQRFNALTLLQVGSSQRLL